jgi:hypothetical protein
MADGRHLMSNLLSPGEVDALLDTAAAWTHHLFHRMADDALRVSTSPAHAG